MTSQKLRMTFLMLIGSLMLQVSHAQSVPTITNQNNTTIRDLTDRVNDAGWLHVKSSARLHPNEMFSTMKSATGLSSNDEMAVKKRWTDDNGWSHARYQQYYKQLPVEGGQWSEHWRDCFVELSHGKLIENLNLNANPAISHGQAVTAAMNAIGATEYAWQNTDWEFAIRQDLADPMATYYPSGELLVGRVLGKEFIGSNYRVAWKFQVRATQPHSFSEVYVDAHTGAILKLKPAGDHDGLALLLYNYGGVQIDDRRLGTKHILRTNGGTRKVHTKYGDGPNPVDADGQNWWWTPNISHFWANWGNDERVGTTAHWSVYTAWDYFEAAHNRTGYDDDGMPIRVWANSESSWGIAARHVIGGHEYIEFGKRQDNNASLGTIDVAGHEFTHGLTANTSGLGGEDEAGALNEGFSDIFATMVERYAFPADFDWLIGEDVYPGGIRSLSDPGSIMLAQIESPGHPDYRPASGLPDTYEGDRWYTGTLDDGGEHINCGVHNYWFYLLAEGGTHNGVTVSGIGIDKAIRITYRNLVIYMQEGSEFADARAGAISAATNIYGECSFEVMQTTNAWAACGVGTTFSNTCLDVDGPALVCVDLFIDFSLHASGPANSTFTWNVPWQWSTFLSGPGNNTLTVTNLANYPAFVPSSIVAAVSSSSGGMTTYTVHFDNCRIPKNCDEGPFFTSGGGNNKTTLEVEAAEMKVYPNPARESITISLPEMDEPYQQLVISDARGVILRKIDNPNYLTKVEIGDWASGYYFIKVVSKSANSSKPFVKMD